MNNKQQLIEFLSTQTEIQEIFTILKQQQINEAVLTAGAVRNLVWDKLTQQKYNILQENIDILFADQGLSYEKLLTKKAIINQKYSKYL
ncbi:nucleotidyltransferase family protein, partial [Liquorilactobacillus nagelii]